VAENYPQLRAVESFLQLQEQLTATEDKLEYARRYYNTSARDYNIAIRPSPGTSWPDARIPRRRVLRDRRGRSSRPTGEFRRPVGVPVAAPASGPPAADSPSSGPPRADRNLMYEQIARNKRRTVACVVTFFVVWVGIGALVGWLWAEVSHLPRDQPGRSDRL
jgi:hypothetical protein